MTGTDGYERPGLAGSGAIACGLAAIATRTGDVRLLARSDASAWRAEEQAQTAAAKTDGGSPGRIRVTTDPSDLAGCDLMIEAIVEDVDAKVELLREVGTECPDADLATTTSSLSIALLGERSGHANRLFGLHVFNPVDRMELVELCIPEMVHAGVANRATAWCRALGKTPIEVPDQSGFVVNRLLFPYLFDAVRLLERGGVNAADVDACMQLGAGHPMGPLRLLDFVGLDVAASIGDSLHAESGDATHAVPETIRSLVAEGKLGRKSGAGFYDYESERKAG
jgi:3-hydroxybutyryl-CoA dehydrogenase